MTSLLFYRILSTWCWIITKLYIGFIKASSCTQTFPGIGRVNFVADKTDKTLIKLWILLISRNVYIHIYTYIRIYILYIYYIYYIYTYIYVSIYICYIYYTYIYIHKYIYIYIYIYIDSKLNKQQIQIYY